MAIWVAAARRSMLREVEARSTEEGAKAEAEAAKVRAMAAEIFMVAIDCRLIIEVIMGGSTWMSSCLFTCSDVLTSGRFFLNLLLYKAHAYEN